MVITKSTDIFNWFIFHKDLSSGANGVYTIQFLTNAENGNYKWWGDGMTDSVIGGTANTSFDPSTETIAYCWHSVAGYSKIGSYPGTGSDGNQITSLGFKPSFILIKRTDSADNWNIVDNRRGNFALFPDLSSQELSNSGAVVFDTDGFTINGNAGGYNNGSGTYLYMAFK